MSHAISRTLCSGAAAFVSVLLRVCVLSAHVHVCVLMFRVRAWCQSLIAWIVYNEQHPPYACSVMESHVLDHSEHVDRMEWDVV